MTNPNVSDILDFSYDSGDENYPMLSKCPQMSREGSLVGTPSFEDMNNEGELLNTLIPSNDFKDDDGYDFIVRKKGSL
jgi:hypothetical protein